MNFSLFLVLATRWTWLPVTDQRANSFTIWWGCFGFIALRHSDPPLFPWEDKNTIDTHIERLIDASGEVRLHRWHSLRPEEKDAISLRLLADREKLPGPVK